MGFIWGSLGSSGGGGTTINPTDGVIPYRVSALAFGDSPLTRVGTSVVSVGVTGPILGIDGNGSLIRAPSGFAMTIGGSATTGTLFFQTVNVNRWGIIDAGHLTAVVDNTYDIGGAGVNRPRNLYLAGSLIAAGATFSGLTAGSVLFAGAAGVVTQDAPNLFWDDTNNRFQVSQQIVGGGVDSSALTDLLINPAVKSSGNLIDAQVAGASKFSVTAAGVALANSHQAAAGGFLYWATRSSMDAPADGVIRLTNNGVTDFARLQFGGTTSAFPALKRVGAGLACRLADDSGDTTFSCSSITLSTPLGPSSGGIGALTPFAVGDMLYASAATVLSKLADVAIGKALISGGVAAVPVWGQINLGTSIVTGVLPPANGGTGGSTVLTQGSVVFAGVGGAFAQDNAQFFWDDTNNRLGIGTAAPVATFHIKTATANVIMAEVTSDWAAIGFSSTLTNANAVLMSSTSLGNVVINRPTGGTLYFQENNSTTHMTILPTSGNVGIGTTTPGVLLGGSAPSGLFLQLASSSAKGQILISTGGNTGAFMIECSTATATKRVFQWRFDAVTNVLAGLFSNESSGSITQANVLVLKNDGNVGIGTGNPTGRLHIVTSDSSGITDLLINPSIKTVGNFLDLQVAGASKFAVGFDGTMSLTRLVIGLGVTSTGLTDLTVNPTSKLSGNLLDLQVNALSKFSVSADGTVTAGATLSVSGSIITTALTDILVNPTAKASGNLLDLKVGGTSKFSVDYLGTITSHMIGCRLVMSPITLVSGTAQVLPCTNETLDTDNMHDNVTNNTRITFKTAGVYLVGAAGGVQAGTGGNRQLSIRINGGGSPASLVSVAAAVNTEPTLMFTQLLFNAAVNDYVEMFLFQNSGGNLNSEFTAITPYFFAVKIN